MFLCGGADTCVLWAVGTVCDDLVRISSARRWTNLGLPKKVQRHQNLSVVVLSLIVRFGFIVLQGEKHGSDKTTLNLACGPSPLYHFSPLTCEIHLSQCDRYI
jgi:hypothetical protein